MSLPWSAQQREWLREMGFDVLARRDAAADAQDAQAGAVALSADADPAQVQGGGPTTGRLEAALHRVAKGIDLAPLLATGLPADAAGRRALWRRLRPLRKAARQP